MISKKTILNMYAPKNTVSKYIRQKLIELQGEIDESTLIVYYQKLQHLSIRNGQIQQAEDQLNSTIPLMTRYNGHLNKTSSNNRIHILLKLTWNIHHILGHKTSLNDF
jgi:hypothetical protein